MFKFPQHISIVLEFIIKSRSSFAHILKVLSKSFVYVLAAFSRVHNI